MGLFNSADYNTLNFLKQELEYVNIHANKYQRLQRKNVKDYLHLRIQELEAHEQDSKKASEIIENNDSDIEQKNTE